MPLTPTSNLTSTFDAHLISRSIAAPDAVTSPCARADVMRGAIVPSESVTMSSFAKFFGLKRSRIGWTIPSTRSCTAASTDGQICASTLLSHSTRSASASVNQAGRCSVTASEARARA